MKKTDMPFLDDAVTLSKLEYASIQAMKGLLSVLSVNDNSQMTPSDENIKYMVQRSIFAAKELLKQLEEEK